MLHHNQLLSVLGAVCDSSRRLQEARPVVNNSRNYYLGFRSGYELIGEISCQNFVPVSWATEAQYMPVVIVVRVDMGADN